MKISRFSIKESFTKKLICIFVAVLAVPLLLNALVSFRNSRNMIEDKTFDYLRNLSVVTMSVVDRSVENVEDTAFYIAGNEQLQTILRMDFSNEVREEVYRNYVDIRNLLSYYVLLSSEISSAYILDQGGQLIGYSKRNDVMDNERVGQMQEGWNLVGDDLLLKKQLRSYKDQALIGELVVAVNAPVFYDLVKEIFEDTESEAFLINEENRIIATRNPADTGEILDGAYLTGEPDQRNLNGVSVEGRNMGIYICNSRKTNWRLVLAVPETYYMKDVWKLRNFNNLLFLLTGIVVILLIIFAGRRMTLSLKKLSVTMEQVGQGYFDVLAPVESQDEIGILSKTFNQMVADMRMLIDNVYRQEMMKQEVEMRSLQMQINPHFLYNTLDTINWIARLRGVDEIGEMTTALGGLMRYSLSGKDFVTIREEFDNLRNYINIQNVRYGDRMEIRFDIQEDTLDYYIPKLLVQPILENAIVHGIEDKIDPGLVQIRSYAENDDLYIEVEDDGVGMTQEAIEALIRNDADQPKKGHTSIGVYNVNRRIQSVFGPDCGLQVQSQLGAGTKIRLCMKKLEHIPDIRLKYD